MSDLKNLNKISLESIKYIESITEYYACTEQVMLVLE